MNDFSANERSVVKSRRLTRRPETVIAMKDQLMMVLDMVMVPSDCRRMTPSQSVCPKATTVNDALRLPGGYALCSPCSKMVSRADDKSHVFGRKCIHTTKSTRYQRRKHYEDHKTQITHRRRTYNCAALLIDH